MQPVRTDSLPQGQIQEKLLTLTVNYWEPRCSGVWPCMGTRGSKPRLESLNAWEALLPGCPRAAFRGTAKLIMKTRDCAAAPKGGNSTAIRADSIRANWRKKLPAALDRFFSAAAGATIERVTKNRLTCLRTAAQSTEDEHPTIGQIAAIQLVWPRPLLREAFLVLPLQLDLLKVHLILKCT